MYRPSPKKAEQEKKEGQIPGKDNKGLMSMSYSAKSSSSSTPVVQHGKVDKLSLSHPKFSERPDRLDLLTHDLLGITTSLGEKEYALCDISETGFSYAQEIPTNPNAPAEQMLDKVDQFGQSNHDKKLPFNFFFRNLSQSGKVRIEGTVRSHSIFFGLDLDEVSMELNGFLERNGIQRKFDGQNFFGKMDRLLQASEEFGERNAWDMHSIIAMNVTFLNFMEEMGAGPNTMAGLQKKYHDRPLFLKFGLSIDNPDEAKEFFLFALHKNATTKKNKEEKRQDLTGIKKPYVEILNQKVSAKKLLLSCWAEGLKHFGLPSSMPDPKPKDREELANLQEAMDDNKGKLEELFDLDFRPTKNNPCQEFLTENFYWPLMEQDKKWANKTKVAAEVRQIMNATFEAYLRKVGYKV